MAGKHTRRAPLKPDGSDIEVKFSERVTEAFADLAAAVHFSDQFDKATLATVQDWAAGNSLTVKDYMTAFPRVADETLKLAQATNDPQAREAWQAVNHALMDTFLEEPAECTTLRATRGTLSRTDGCDIKVKPSPEVAQAFKDLAAAVHFSDDFGWDIKQLLKSWNSGKG